MADSNKTDSGSAEESKASGPCWSFIEMPQMMQQCCGFGEVSVDLEAMTQDKCCGKPKEPEK